MFVRCEGQRLLLSALLALRSATAQGRVDFAEPPWPTALSSGRVGPGPIAGGSRVPALSAPKPRAEKKVEMHNSQVKHLKKSKNKVYHPYYNLYNVSI